MRKGFWKYTFPYFRIKGIMVAAILVMANAPLVGQEFKVVGYLPSYRFKLMDKIKFEQMTHVCLSFANPNALGDLSFPNNEDPTPVIQKAQKAGAQVFLSLAGGGDEKGVERGLAQMAATRIPR